MKAKFNIDDHVRVRDSEQVGIVLGVYVHKRMETQYIVEFDNGNDEKTDSWHFESTLEAAELDIEDEPV